MPALKIDNACALSHGNSVGVLLWGEGGRDAGGPRRRVWGFDTLNYGITEPAPRPVRIGSRTRIKIKQ